MEKFMGENFLLKNPTAVKLYHEYAKKQPIIDYHCHIDPKQIANNIVFDNITEVWLGGDHYKWRQMRSNGVPEELVTGDGDAFLKFEAYAKTLENAIGNPLYHWSHLELKTYFGYDGVLCGATAKEVYDLCNEKLKNMPVRDIIKMSNVEMIGTTDDPAGDLAAHIEIKNDSSIDVAVLPTLRPDRAMNIEKPDFCEYLATLSAASGIEISDFKSLKKALGARMDFFGSVGCKATDHGLDYVMYSPADDEEIELIFAKKKSGETLSCCETAKYKTAFMLFMASECKRMDFVMQLHYGCKRNNNTDMFQKIGADTGFDCISNYTPSAELADFLNAVNTNSGLPKTVVYSLNPADNASIGTIIGCFQDNSAEAGKIQHGSAWWFNDTKTGMQEQMISLANLGLLGNFIGMLTDSRSFLSYTRHEYFRRILCNIIGEWVEDGEFPSDFEALRKIVENISYYNAKRYFSL